MLKHRVADLELAESKRKYKSSRLYFMETSSKFYIFSRF